MVYHRDEAQGGGMMDDEYWASFSADFADYELGGPVGYGASSIVYSAVFRPSQPTPPPSCESDLPGRRADLHIELPGARGRAQYKSYERRCAIKISSSHPDVQQLFKEARLLSLCKHPNVLRNLATFTLPPDHRRIAIVTPLVAGGSLAGILDWRRRLSDTPKQSHRFSRLHLGGRAHDDGDGTEPAGNLEEDEIKAVTKQVLEGLQYLHDNGYLHRDLKAGNLLIEPDGTVLLADFGVGGDMNEAVTPSAAADHRPILDQIRFTDPPADIIVDSARRPPVTGLPVAEDGKRRSFVGTPSWMAPEVVMGRKYDTRADVWSLGITLLELAHGYAPGSKDKVANILRHTVQDAPPSLDRSIGNYSRSFKEFIDSCLQKDPDQRPTSKALLEHPWLRGAKKKAFLAESLLADVPLLENRQELRRVPTMSSMASRASSWDFSFAPSEPVSPLRTSAYSTMRSSSIISQMRDDLATMPSFTHSRTSSRIPSLPPSPRVSLRQWAEQTSAAGADSFDGGDLRQRRTGSETGRPRSRHNSIPIRRGQSTYFEHQGRHESSEMLTASPGTAARANRRLPSVDTGFGMSPVAEASWAPPLRMTVPLLDEKELKNEGPCLITPDLRRTTSPEEVIVTELEQIQLGRPVNIADGGEKMDREGTYRQKVEADALSDTGYSTPTRMSGEHTLSNTTSPGSTIETHASPRSNELAKKIEAGQPSSPTKTQEPMSASPDKSLVKRSWLSRRMSMNKEDAGDSKGVKKSGSLSRRFAAKLTHKT